MSSATKTKNTQPAKNKPAHEIRTGGSLKATIWLNTTQQGKQWFSTQFTRSFKTSEGEWKETSQMNSSDLLLLSKLAQMAHEWIAAQS